jgi:catechol-2,3-dioxygenase
MGMLPFTQIKETCLYSRNLDVMEAFYTDILELPPIGKAEGRHVFFRAGSSVLLIFNPESTLKEKELPPHAGYGPIHIAFEVKSADYLDAKEKFISKGVNILHEATWKSGGKSFYFHDPEGHVLEIVEEGIWEG